MTLPRQPRARSFTLPASAIRTATGIDRTLIATFVATRVLLVVAALVAELLIPRNPALTSGDGAPILRSLTSWDGWYFLGIAREGYHVDPVSGAYRDIAFLPLYPALVRLFSLPWPAFAGLVSVLLSNGLLLLALGQLSLLGALQLGRRRARLAASLMAIYPFASAYAMAYSDSLFLLLSVGAFLAAERDRRMASGILLALACLTRLQGVVLLVPLALLMARRGGWVLGKPGWRPSPSLLWLLLGPLAGLGFLAAVGAFAGSPAAWLDAQRAWGREGIGGAAPGQTIASGFTPYQAALLFTLCWSVFLFVFRRRSGVRAEYVLIPVLYLAAELSSGTLEAVGRVTMTAFPYAWFLATPRGLTFRIGWPLLSTGLFVAVALLSFGGYWVP